MQELTLGSWEEFVEQFVSLRATGRGGKLGLLYRGHGNSQWPLDTTLQREGNAKFSVRAYYRLISRIKPQIETFTDAKWDTPTHDDIEKLTEEYDAFSRALAFGQLPAYRYIAYLRHHGFPSPLMDWTRSPFVAAYFAFRKPTHKYVCIYVYSDAPSNVRISGMDKPSIYRLGPYVQTHKRHFLQQSEYTACVAFQDGWFFVPHTGRFSLPGNDEDIQQDILWKFNLPAAERPEVLRSLDEHNLNAYSLFGSDDSLMETMAVRELLFSRS